MENLDFLAKYTNLSDFQYSAFQLIKNYENKSENILITAPTGSGKSLIAEYAIYNYIKKNKKKVIYTSPIKSLSNQKFYDFNEKFNKYDISVGILTGDIKFAPQADCIIMTTEILLNLLMRFINNNTEFEINFNDIGCIIFDEVHYINDVDRGNIWEQAIMCIPNHIQLIMLSATLNQPEFFGKWVENIQNKPTNIISTNHRVVPLYFNLYYYISEKEYSKLSLINKNAIEYNKLLSIYDTEKNKFDNILYDKVILTSSLIKNKKNNTVDIINGMLHNFSKDMDMYPLLFFVLNKKKCLEYAKSIVDIYNNLDEQKEVEDYLKYNINLEYINNNDTYATIIKLVIKGIGIHHSGLLPIFKEIIEILYNKKLIKVLFATETFAVGLNMPTKTVVFCNMFKCNRILESHEFIQMAGRAGRRNIDILGNVIILPQLNKNISTIDMKNILTGKGQLIESKFNINEILILKLLKNNLNINIDNILIYIKKSLMSSTYDQNIIHQEKIVNKYEIYLDEDDLNNIKIFKDINNPYFKLSKKQMEIKKKLINEIGFIEKYNKKNNYNIEKKKLDNMSSCLKNEIIDVCNSLIKYDMIDEDLNMTNKGYLGTFINEIHPIPVIDIITHDKFNNLDENSLIIILSTLIFDNDNDRMDYQIFKNYKCKYIWIEIIDEIYSKTIIDYFNFKYVWLLDEYLKTNIYISKYTDDDYLFEGNFIKAINKLINLLNEIKNIYDETKNIELSKKIDICLEKLNKDWLKIDSIYLRMSGIIL